MASIPLPKKNKDMEFFEERERMRKLLQMKGKIVPPPPPPPPIRRTNYGMSGTSGASGTTGHSGVMEHSDYGCLNSSSGSQIDPNLYVTSGTTQYNSSEKVGGKVKPRIEPVISEREKVKTNWKFWKK